jgi:hypothetical protein
MTNGTTAEALPNGWHRGSLSDIAGRPQYGWTTRAKADAPVKLLRTTDITRGVGAPCPAVRSHRRT